MERLQKIFDIKIILSSFILANLICLIETYVDANKDNKSLLVDIFNPPPNELYERLGILFIITFFGAFISILVKKIKTSEEEKTKIIEDLNIANMEIKTLRGIIPICSHCKNIRDDEGYWSQVEVYVRQRTEADFTHSICPDCAQKHYPEFMDSNVWKKNRK